MGIFMEPYALRQFFPKKCWNSAANTDLLYFYHTGLSLNADLVLTHLPVCCQKRLLPRVQHLKPLTFIEYL